jgi:hypothetical protein
VHEAAVRIRCANNLTHLDLAEYNHESAFRILPTGQLGVTNYPVSTFGFGGVASATDWTCAPTPVGRVTETRCTSKL